jgi:hypothetical protein
LGSIILFYVHTKHRVFLVSVIKVEIIAAPPLKSTKPERLRHPMYFLDAWETVGSIGLQTPPWHAGGTWWDWIWKHIKRKRSRFI